MESEKNDLQYKNLIKDLNQLQEVKAPKYFEADLMRRINSEDFKKKNRFLDFGIKIFLLQSWFQLQF